MTVALASGLLAEIRSQAEAGYPHEICGFLLGSLDADTKIFVAVGLQPMANRRADEPRRYLIDPDSYRSVERRAAGQDQEIVGVYHSHPDAPARPSEYDRELAWPNCAYLIAAVVNGVVREVTAWVLADDRMAFAPLEILLEDAKPVMQLSEGA